MSGQRRKRLACRLGFHDYRDKLGFAIPHIRIGFYDDTETYACRRCGKNITVKFKPGSLF